VVSRIADDVPPCRLEGVKVFEGVYRDVNIALANQLAMYSGPIDADMTEAIDVANTQSFCDIHVPGPGVGGHCIPVYPYFLTGAFDAHESLLTTARHVNDGMPEYTVRLLREILDVHGVEQSAPHVLLLGVTYKANIEELRNAPALAISRSLRDWGMAVSAVDPLLDDWTGLDNLERVDLSEVYEQEVDAVVLVTPHDEFAQLDWEEFNSPILDGRQAIDSEAVDAPVYSIGGRWP
jgi:UDP-N-acetyl-D-mannosaminuronic acid dehydrogenase